MNVFCDSTVFSLGILLYYRNILTATPIMVKPASDFPGTVPDDLEDLNDLGDVTEMSTFSGEQPVWTIQFGIFEVGAFVFKNSEFIRSEICELDLLKKNYFELFGLGIYYFNF